MKWSVTSALGAIRAAKGAGPESSGGNAVNMYSGSSILAGALCKLMQSVKEVTYTKGGIYDIQGSLKR